MTDSNSSRGNCELINSNFTGQTSSYVGGARQTFSYVGGGLVNIIRRNRNDGHCRNGEDVAQN